MEQEKLQKSIDQYKLIKKLGEGTFGAVWLALNTITGQECAVKILKGERSSQNAISIKKKFQLICMLNHPNIIKAYDFSVNGVHQSKQGAQSPNKIYMVTELVKNGE